MALSQAPQKEMHLVGVQLATVYGVVVYFSLDQLTNTFDGLPDGSISV
jgi:hypothetical protein